jgi:transposase
MRGENTDSEGVFSYVRMHERVPASHPLRPVLAMCREVLHELSPLFDTLYAKVGRPSIPPEKLLRALLLQLLYSVRSERMLMEQLEYNMLFRWFVGLSMDEPVWDASTFSKNRDRLLAGDVALAFFTEVVELARRRGLLSDEHFVVDGTLIEAWASQKSFRPKDDDQPRSDFHGEKRTNDTHRSLTDPDARLTRKGNGCEARLAYLGNLLMDAKHCLPVGARLTKVSGSAEREVALDLLAEVPGRHQITVGADKGYDTAGFVEEARELNARPHVARKSRGSAIDGRTTRHPGYAASQRVRKLIEPIHGWMKNIGLLRKTKLRGEDRVGFAYVFGAAAFALVRMRTLLPEGC